MAWERCAEPGAPAPGADRGGSTKGSAASPSFKGLTRRIVSPAGGCSSCPKEKDHPMFRRSIFISAFVAVFAAACDQGGGAVDNSPGRKERILENLKAKFPQLAELNPSLGDFKRVAPGVDEVVMTFQTPRGEQKQTMLVLTDNTSLYMTMEGPVDVSKDASQLKAAKEKEREDRQQELAKAVEGKPIRGSAEAKVTIIEFSDFQCPFCKRGAETIEKVLEKYPNDVKLVFMHFPLQFHDWAKPAAVATVCATRQDPQSLWKLHDAFFANQGQVTAQNVVDKAKEFLGDTKIDMQQWQKCAKEEGSPEHQQAVQAVEAEMALGSKLGVQGTPAFFINGEFVNGALPFEHFERIIQQQLNQKS